MFQLTHTARTDGYSVREELPLPTQPPYTAHLGNMSFDATQGDVADFFQDCDVSSVRIVEDKMDRKPKGFGYVEFNTVDGLKKALTLNGTNMGGRMIRISVADPRKCQGILQLAEHTDTPSSQERSSGHTRLRRLVAKGPSARPSRFPAKSFRASSLPRTQFR
jgi:RNA recognition motif-containing protein